MGGTQYELFSELLCNSLKLEMSYESIYRSDVVTPVCNIRTYTSNNNLTGIKVGQIVSLVIDNWYGLISNDTTVNKDKLLIDDKDVTTHRSKGGLLETFFGDNILMNLNTMLYTDEPLVDYLMYLGGKDYD